MTRRDTSLEPGSYDYYRERFRTWGLRFYAGAFITFGLLALQRAVRHHHRFHQLVWVLICIVGGTAIAAGIYAYTYAVRYRLLRRRAGGRYWG